MAETNPAGYVAQQDLPVQLNLAASSASAAPRNRTFRRFLQHRMAVFGLAVIVLLMLLAVFAPIAALQSPYTIDARSIRESPSFRHIMGTDTAGRDQWARLVYAARVSLSVGLVAVSIYIVIGTTLGALAGYFGNRVDQVIMRLTDVIMCFPSLIIIITVVSVLGPSIFNVMIVIGLLGWPSTCRLVRGQFLTLRKREFVEAVHCLGVPSHRIIFRHILPNVVAYIIVDATFGVGGAILTEAGLSFLGLGVQPPTPSWGNMLTSAQNLTTLERYPWIWIPPGAMIAISVLAINFIGDGLRDALDPKSVL